MKFSPKLLLLVLLLGLGVYQYSKPYHPCGPKYFPPDQSVYFDRNNKDGEEKATKAVEDALALEKNQGNPRAGTLCLNTNDGGEWAKAAGGASTVCFVAYEYHNRSVKFSFFPNKKMRMDTYYNINPPWNPNCDFHGCPDYDSPQWNDPYYDCYH